MAERETQEQVVIEVLPLPDDLDTFEEQQEQAAADPFAPENRYTLTTQHDFERAMRRRAANLKIAAEIAHPFDVEIAERREKIFALEAEVAQLQAGRDAGAKPWLGRATWYTSLIEVYFRQRNQEDPRIKSWPTPYGETKLTKQQPEWRYEDEEAIGVWLNFNATRFCKAKFSPIKTDLKKAVVVNKDGTVSLLDTGEIIPGVVVVERPPKFEIKD